MLGIYFSGTGNSRYALEVFLREYDETAQAYSIEEADITDYIKDNKDIVFSYPVQYSNIPKMLKDFVDRYKHLWQGKRVFVIATMGLFSGDGAGILARRFRKYGAQITGGLHLKMPDSIADEKALKRPMEKNMELVKTAENKISDAVRNIKNGKSPQEGIGALYHFAGLFGQRLYFYNKTKQYTDKIKIDTKTCVGCGKCVELCPMKNLNIENNFAKAEDRCTMCYRCINNCPKQAITLLGKRVIEQGTIDKYIKK
ncbi:MAG: EFR1 family ferrodoxin [Lachnospiraceae bacterium]|nr:EFR1 family ferrodoxin [Lachnospiraceae bacterium]